MEAATKVLIIDDTPSNLALLYDLLESRGCKVFVSQDGASGKALAAEIIPDIILLDIMMPGGDGFDVSGALKGNPETAEIPIIFLSALDDVESKVKAFRLGAVDYISKPLRQEEVLARIQLQVELKRNRTRILELERTNTVLAMALTASHELTQPLTSLKGNLDLLELELVETGLISTSGIAPGSPGTPGTPSPPGTPGAPSPPSPPGPPGKNSPEIAGYLLKCKDSIRRMEELVERYRSAAGAEDLEYGGGRRMFHLTGGG